MGFLKKLFGGEDDAPKERHPLEDEVNYYIPKDDNDIAMMKTNVAGITHYLKLSDAPKLYQGYAKPEPENPYNDKAVALITDEGKRIGYIPDQELSLYNRIFEGRESVQFFCMVGIFRNHSDKRTLYGKLLLVTAPANEKADMHQRLTQKQFDYMAASFTTE